MKKIIAIVLVIATLIAPVIFTSCSCSKQEEKDNSDSKVLTEVMNVNKIDALLKNVSSIKVISNQSHQDGTSAATWSMFYSKEMFLEQCDGLYKGQDGYLAYNLIEDSKKRVYSFCGEEKAVYFGYETTSSTSIVDAEFLMNGYLKLNGVTSLLRLVDLDFVIKDEIVRSQQTTGDTLVINTYGKILAAYGIEIGTVECTYKVDSTTKRLKSMKIVSNPSSSNPYIREYSVFYDLAVPTEKDYVVDISSLDTRSIMVFNTIDNISGNFLSRCPIGYKYFPIVEDGYAIYIDQKCTTKWSGSENNDLTSGKEYYFAPVK